MAGVECKLCGKIFSNGKAMGGHMRSHYATFPLPPKTPQRTELTESPTESTLSSNDSGERSSLSNSFYGLREKPKKSIRVADLNMGSESVIVDGENGTGSTRCKKAKRMKRVSEKRFSGELEMEEDVALCLMMLSRDVWRRSDDELMRMGGGKVHKCEKCDRVFRSSQGLGSHRASHHKKIKKVFGEVSDQKNEKVYECLFCDKVFKSAQGLGGHKRSHFLAAKVGGKLENGNVSDKSGDSAIDLNVAAVMEDDEFVSEEEDEVLNMSL